jgi:type I restriction enzyme M protein
MITEEGSEAIRKTAALGATASKVAELLAGKFANGQLSRDGASSAVAAVLKQVGTKPSESIVSRLLQNLAVYDPKAGPELDARGKPVPDPSLRDTEDIPLGVDAADYMAREVLPFRPDAWPEEGKARIGYEIPFNFHFFAPPTVRPLTEIDQEIASVEHEILQLLSET